MSVHCLGVAHPASRYLTELLAERSSEDIYSYSDISCSKLDIFPYSSLSKSISVDDVIVSFLPIRVLADILDQFNIYSYRFHSLIVITSTSVFSRIYKKSKDSSSYLDFIVGEHMLLSRLTQLTPQPFKLIVLRTTMLWGSFYDSNISLIHLLLSKFRFFPVSSRCSGLRRPLHYSQLAFILNSLLAECRTIHQPYLLANIQGPVEISFIDMVNLIRSTVSGFTVLLVIPYPLLALLTFMVPSSSAASSAALMLCRQRDDLIYTDQPTLACLNPVYPHRFSFYSLMYSEFSPFN